MPAHSLRGTLLLLAALIGSFLVRTRENASQDDLLRTLRTAVWTASGLVVPAIAVLTLNSGICGDKMVYLSMFNDHDVPITSQEFLRGASYLDHLKVWGVDYLDKCGYSFYSSDPFVAAILDHAKSHKRILTREDKVLSEVTKFATA